jgi:hypothetical protein
MISTYGITPDEEVEGIGTWTDPRYRYMTVTNSWFYRILNKLQRRLTQISRALPDPDLYIAGYALVGPRKDEKGKTLALEAKRFPGSKIRINEDDKPTIIELEVDRDPIPRAAARTQFQYLAVMASFIRRMIEVEGFSFADYVAYSHNILMQYVQVGNPNFDKWFTAADVVDQVKAFIGIGIAEENTFLFREEESWLNAFHFWVALGLVAARTVPTTTPGTFRVLKGLLYTVKETFSEVIGGNLNDISGRGMPYYMMASTTPGGNQYFPCCVREKELHDVNFYCVYRKPRRFTMQPSIDTVDVMKGETVNTTLEHPTMLRERKWIKWRKYSDARQYSIEYEMRVVTMFKFPHMDNYPEDGFSEKKDC